MDGAERDIEAFIARWTVGAGGAERANYVMFLSELCDLIGVGRPDPAEHDTRFNDYVFERAVLDRGVEVGPRKRIDLYKKNHFVLEAKQSRTKDRQGDLFAEAERGAAFQLGQGRRTASRQWDALMKNARQQAEEYAWRVAREHGWPPFLIVCDVGHCFEIYADFSGQGRNYAPDAAAVRIAMTVASNDAREGVLREVVQESGLETDTPRIELSEVHGVINSDLTIGIDATRAKPLWANAGVCSPGVKLHGDGFIVRPSEAEVLGLGRRAGLERHIRHYRNGRDLTGRPRGAMVIDLFGLQAEAVRRDFPEVYAHVVSTVKEVKDEQGKVIGRDANPREAYRDNWWVFGEPRADLRPALSGLGRYIATTETAKHRPFQFLDSSILPDNMLVCVASANALLLGVLSSKPHLIWVDSSGGTLEDRPRYTKSLCFDPFPFPDASQPMRERIARVAEDLDAHRKRVQAEHPDITLTDMCNVLEAVREERELTEKEARIRDAAAVLTLKSYHDDLDALVIEAYGWPAGISDERILEKLVALNAERAAEEARGEVKWLRPDYQIPRFAKKVGAPAQIEADLEVAEDKTKPSFPLLPAARTAAVMAAFLSIDGVASATEIAKRFKQGRQVEAPIKRTLRALARMGFLTTEDGERYGASRGETRMR